MTSLHSSDPTRDSTGRHPDATGRNPIVEELRSIVGAHDYPLLLQRSTELADRARWSPDPGDLAHDLRRLAADGTIHAMVAIESLVEVQHATADQALVDLLSDPAEIVRRHAAWRLGDRQPSEQALPALVEMITVGGIGTMHAHRTLRRWSSSLPHSIQRAAITHLIDEEDLAGRSRLVDLLGSLGTDTDRVLLHVALDEQEATSVRAAAIGALGERRHPSIGDALRRLAAYDEAVGTEAALALNSRWPGDPHGAERPDDAGLRVAHVVLAEGLDAQLSLGGRGDTGGVASLLVSLGEALARRPDVDHVLTIGRGSVTDAAVGPLSSSRGPLSFGMVSFGDDERPGDDPDQVWEHLPAIERGIRRALRQAGPIDVLHLRMADAGTLAGASIANEMGVPFCFSVAPDPHNVIESLHARGELDDDSFVRLATDTHVWFRARLIEDVARDADQLALFPRSEPVQFLRGLDVDDRDRRPNVAVVAEGIDISLIDWARTIPVESGNATCQGDVLDDLAAAIAPTRRHLPLLVSVGRLNPVKGMDRVVAAWAADPGLHANANLVIVGGDLAQPSPTEASVLGVIDRLVPPDDPCRAGIILLGGRPRGDVARLLVAAMSGRPGAWAAGGVYVDGAVKEEFGLAVLEAMAAGLVVVAPSTGGPSTYVDADDTGILVDPGADLGEAIRRAFGLVDRAGRVERARDLIEERYSIDTMAARLVGLYRPSLVSQ